MKTKILLLALVSVPLNAHAVCDEVISKIFRAFEVNSKAESFEVGASVYGKIDAMDAVSSDTKSKKEKVVNSFARLPREGLIRKDSKGQIEIEVRRYPVEKYSKAKHVTDIHANDRTNEYAFVLEPKSCDLESFFIYKDSKKFKINAAQCVEFYQKIENSAEELSEGRLTRDAKEILNTSDEELVRAFMENCRNKGSGHKAPRLLASLSLKASSAHYNPSQSGGSVRTPAGQHHQKSPARAQTLRGGENENPSSTYERMDPSGADRGK